MRTRATGDPKNLIRISEENYNSAAELVAHGRWNAAITRLYYAVFQLLYLDQLNKNGVRFNSDNKHGRIGDIVEKEYGREISEIFHQLKDLRVDADYRALFIGSEQFKCMKSQVDLKYEAIKKRVSA